MVFDEAWYMWRWALDPPFYGTVYWAGSYGGVTEYVWLCPCEWSSVWLGVGVGFFDCEDVWLDRRDILYQYISNMRSTLNESNDQQRYIQGVTSRHHSLRWNDYIEMNENPISSHTVRLHPKSDHPPTIRSSPESSVSSIEWAEGSCAWSGNKYGFKWGAVCIRLRFISRLIIQVILLRSTRTCCIIVPWSGSRRSVSFANIESLCVS
jgi:hypothetical protein